ncbi:hypothetical protein [Chryseobacterium sp. KCF3-3]|uniref:hypothetical protein n=1 Tax=Chryseobacterium sp. KCF3-3 TaxID=3231511 RepID=UPI0038B370BE
MKTKFITIVSFFFFTTLFGQLRLDFKLINSVANITIYNDSEESYIFPLDRSHFRPYESICDAFDEYEKEFPSFGLMVNIINSEGNKENYILGYNKDSERDAILYNLNKRREKLKKEVMIWSKNNNIKNYNLAYINYEIMKNLIYLKPKEKVTFNVNLDLNNVTNQELIFYNYILEESHSYQLYLNLCEFKEISKYLTASQKVKLQKYKFLNNYIDSNIINIKIKNNSPVN